MTYTELHRKIAVGDFENDAAFKKLLFEHYSITENPKRELLYKIAWDIGHSNGFTEVLYYFDEMVELIK